MSTELITTEAAPAGHPLPRWRRWTDPRMLRAGLGSGLLGGLCCIGAAIATAAGLGAAGFFSGLMERYQLYFILASVAFMALWLVRHLRRRGASLRDWHAVARAIGRHALVMAIVYAVTLGLAMAVAQLVTM